jgi:hypothetical protein
MLHVNSALTFKAGLQLRTPLQCLMFTYLCHSVASGGEQLILMDDEGAAPIRGTQKRLELVIHGLHRHDNCVLREEATWCRC